MSLLQALREILGMTPDSSSPEEENLPDALGPTARQYVYVESLPERFQPANKLEICVSVRREAPDKPATTGDMEAVRKRLRNHALSINTEDRQNALFVIGNALEPEILEDVAAHEAVVSVYIAREWGEE